MNVLLINTYVWYHHLDHSHSTFVERTSAADQMLTMTTSAEVNNQITHVTFMYERSQFTLTVQNGTKT